MEETIKKRTVFQEKVAEMLINCENTMPVGNIYQLKGHRGSAFHRILIAASRAEAAVAAKRNKLQVIAMRANVHGAAKRRIPTMDHFINIFHLRFSGMKSIFNFFIIIGENSL